MDIFKKAADSVNKMLPANVQEKVKAAAEKADSVVKLAEDAYEKHVTPEMKAKAKELSGQALKGAKVTANKLMDVAEKQIIDKYVSKETKAKMVEASSKAQAKVAEMKESADRIKKMNQEIDDSEKENKKD